MGAMFCPQIPSNSFNLPLNCRSMKVWKHLSSLQTNVIGSACLALQMTQIFLPMRLDSLGTSRVKTNLEELNLFVFELYMVIHDERCAEKRK